MTDLTLAPRASTRVFGLSARMRDAATRLRRWHMETRVHNGLARLSDKELADLGYSRGTLGETARAMAARQL
ncbi:MAG: DUF1127 domain-containing protein [Rubricella sp.]